MHIREVLLPFAGSFVFLHDIVKHSTMMYVNALKSLVKFGI